MILHVFTLFALLFLTRCSAKITFSVYNYVILGSKSREFLLIRKSLPCCLMDPKGGSFLGLIALVPMSKSKHCHGRRISFCSAQIERLLAGTSALYEPWLHIDPNQDSILKKNNLERSVSRTPQGRQFSPLCVFYS